MNLPIPLPIPEELSEGLALVQQYAPAVLPILKAIKAGHVEEGELVEWAKECLTMLSDAQMKRELESKA